VTIPGDGCEFPILILDVFDFIVICWVDGEQVVVEELLLAVLPAEEKNFGFVGQGCHRITRGQGVSLFQLKFLNCTDLVLLSIDSYSPEIIKLLLPASPEYQHQCVCTLLRRDVHQCRPPTPRDL